MKTHSERHDKRRYCCFHREYDHDTEECHDLQYQIEDLIRHRHLHRYAYTRTEVGKRPTHDEDLDITFRSGNEEYPCHDDALVISIRMANAYIKRVLIDTGSSTDILYFNVFQKLGLTDKDLVTLADPQPAQGSRLNLSSAHEVPDPSRGRRGQE
ncbi:hypothetical protein B296_00006592 [Ensete ventricosum]|uniref:Peptidase A2 domain-containing protein n=1 Tax=Ensete ventricosum TaxID=4639 RepID=A0A426Y8C1_ENSVE|nr:hypothetical protein B296_00006592 [Ensete ventricosum]